MHDVRTAVMVYLVSILISVFSQILLKISANKTYPSHLREYLNPHVIIAYGMFFISTILTMLALKYVPLSSGPVLESLSYVLVPVLSYFILKESLNRRKILGMAVILAGVFLFNLSL
ncbi:MAG: EamA family transporter [Mogibacterium sp.]|nr:EamA family transporter [Mogibacterium sp.]